MAKQPIRTNSLMNLRTILLLFLSVLSVELTSCDQHKETGEISELSESDQALIKKMKGASIPEIKAFIREVLDEELPENYEVPQHIIDAGDANEATRVVGERYPEFVNKEGAKFLASIAANPIRYKLIIRESQAIRKHYHDVIYNETE